MMQCEPQKEHAWLGNLVGEWISEMECHAGSDKPAETVRGTDSVRSLGGIWVVCEGKGDMPGGGVGLTIMTLGYDPMKKGFVGTFVGSMMTNLWIYDGQLDADGKRLVLSAEGPNFADPTKTAKYRDVIEFIDDDHRTLSSYTPDDSGNWQQFMTAHYRRVK